jgi:TPR repeat protein
MGLTPLAAMKLERSRRGGVAGAVVAAATMIGVFQPSRASAQAAPPTACDSAASFAYDVQRVAPGVGYDSINAPFAMSQCAQAVRFYPASGRLYFEFGRALEKAGRLPRAIAAYGRAAQLGHGGGFNNLGELYRAGKGVPRDLSMAQREFEQGAALGYPEAQYNLANMLLRRARTDANIERARQLLTSALNAGYSAAAPSLQALPLPQNAVPSNAAAGPPTLGDAHATGPSFDCSKIGQDALSAIICSSPELSAQNLLLGQTYYALRHQVGPIGQDDLKAEAKATNNAMKRHCLIPNATPLPFPSQSYVACVQSDTKHIRDSWMARLTHGSFANLEEAQRPVDELIAAQRELIRQGLLSNTNTADGLFGDGTRKALMAWQATHSVPPTGALDDRTATSLLNLPNAPSAQPKTVAQAQPVLTAATAPQAAPSPANPILAKVFTPKMLDIQIPYLETIVGPAMRLTKLQHDLEMRTYQVGDCELLTYSRGNTVSAYGLRLKAGCAADLSQFIQHPVVANADATFGSLADALGGGKGTYQSACIYGCGNAADARVEWTWEGSNAQGQIKVQLAVTLVAPESINAATTWQNAMSRSESQQYVASAHFNCDGKYQSEASGAFRSVRITDLFVGHGESIDDQDVAMACPASGGAPDVSPTAVSAPPPANIAMNDTVAPPVAPIAPPTSVAVPISAPSVDVTRPSPLPTMPKSVGPMTFLAMWFWKVLGFVGLLVPLSGTYFVATPFAKREIFKNLSQKLTVVAIGILFVFGGGEFVAYCWGNATDDSAAIAADAVVVAAKEAADAEAAAAKERAADQTRHQEEDIDACRILALNSLLHGDDSTIGREVAEQFVGDVIGSSSDGGTLIVEVKGVQGAGGRCQAKSVIKCSGHGGALRLISGPDDDGSIPC